MKSVFKTMSFAHFLSTTLLLFPLLATITSSLIFAAAWNTNNPNPNPITNNQKIKNAPLALSEELGCSPTLKALMEPFNKNSSGNKNQAMVYFDPLNLATDDNFGRYREAELKHGRVSMLVVVSCIAQTIAKQNDPVAYFTSGQTPKLGQLLQEYAAGNGDSNTTWILRLTQVLLVCGILETLLLVQASPQDMPGDYGVGYLGVRDKGKNERSLVSELENGRVAMMTLLYWAILEAWPVSPIPNLFRGLFSSSSAGEQAHYPWDGLLLVLTGRNNDPLAAMMGEIMTFGSDGGGGVDDIINTAAAAAVDASGAAATSIGNVL